MAWPDDLAAEFPRPNPDEPKTLRDDILDELRDHLQSSLELEQLKGTPPSEAEEVVISRFGNPVQMARQLWWEAMKGRIMSQRITIGLVIVLCLFSVVATAMLWQTVQQGQQTTAALIAKLEKIAERPAPPAAAPAQEPQYFDWVPVTVRLKDEQGQPVTGNDWTVSINGALYRDGEHASNTTHPNEEGACDLGPVRLGIMDFSVESPRFSTRMSKSVRPGKPFQLDVTVPSGEPAKIEQALSVHWPEKVNNEALWTHLVLAYQPVKMGGQTWEWISRQVPTTYYTNYYVNDLQSSRPETYRGPDSLPAGISVLISPAGKLFVGELEPEELYYASSRRNAPGGYEQTYYSKIFSQDFFRRYQSPHHFRNQARRYEDPADSLPATVVARESYPELFPLVHFREAVDADLKLDSTDKLSLPKEGVWVYLMSVIAVAGDKEVTDAAREFSGRVVSVSSRPLNYWGVGGNDGFDGANSTQASPLAQMLKLDDKQKTWKFVPSDEIVQQMQKNLAELHLSLEARGKEKPEEAGGTGTAPAENPKEPNPD